MACPIIAGLSAYSPNTADRGYDSEPMRTQVVGWTVVLSLTGAWAQSPPADPAGWKPLFDGSTLKGWQETAFTGHGKVTVQDSAIVLGKGYMTGINWTGEFPKSNYELRLEAMRVDGYDFFAGITFPVHDSFCSWINGGWGGMVVGLSSLDDMDASENDTMRSRNFQSGRWYRLRLRVTDARIQAWIDDEPIIDADISDRAVGLRPGEIELSKPLGIASYSTTAKLRKIEYRAVTDKDKGDAK